MEIVKMPQIINPLFYMSKPFFIQPLGDRVVVQPIDADQKTASGIIIPDSTEKEKPQEGIVLALGNGGIGKDQENPNNYLKVGDKVLFGKYVGDDVKLKDKKDLKIKILKLEAILGLVK